MDDPVQSLEPSSKTSISIKFPDIYSASASQSPSINNSTNNGGNSSRCSSSSLNEISKFAKDCLRANELLTAGEKADIELIEIKNDLIKVIVNTLMVNK